MNTEIKGLMNAYELSNTEINGAMTALTMSKPVKLWHFAYGRSSISPKKEKTKTTRRIRTSTIAINSANPGVSRRRKRRKKREGRGKGGTMRLSYRYDNKGCVNELTMFKPVKSLHLWYGRSSISPTTGKTKATSRIKTSITSAILESEKREDKGDHKK